MKRTFTTVSNAEFYEILREDAAEGMTNWTISGKARVGNRILLYVCAPISAIVATAIVSTVPEIETDPTSPWLGHHLADMHDLRMLQRPITRAALIQAFPSWRYWRQPRNGVQVPEAYLSALEAMLSADDAPPAMRWTAERPVDEGRYLFRVTPADSPRQAFVRVLGCEQVQITFDDSAEVFQASELRGEWAGPLSNE